MRALFPIMDDPSGVIKSVPWDMLSPHEKQVERNHSQTLSRLAERGGLSPTEAIAILEDKSYTDRWPQKYTKEIGVYAAATLYHKVMAFCQADDARADLLARVKELEETIGDMKRFNTDLANEADRLRTQLYQRDTALVAAREALEEAKARSLRKRENWHFIDHALSQIQACEVRK